MASLIITRRSFFTLIELLVVLLLTTIGMAVTGIKIKETYDQQKFFGEIQQVLSHLQVAQDTMLVLQTDMQIKFKRDPDTKAIYYTLMAENPLPTYIANILKGEHTLKAIRGMQFEDQSISDEAGITLKFFSKGMVMSQGVLILSQDAEGKDSSKSHQIELAGHPRFFESKQYQSGNSISDQKLQNLIRKDLYPKIIFEEQNEKVNNPKK